MTCIRYAIAKGPLSDSVYNCIRAIIALRSQAVDHPSGFPSEELLQADCNLTPVSALKLSDLLIHKASLHSKRRRWNAQELHQNIKFAEGTHTCDTLVNNHRLRCNSNLMSCSHGQSSPSSVAPREELVPGNAVCITPLLTSVVIAELHLDIVHHPCFLDHRVIDTKEHQPLCVCYCTSGCPSVVGASCMHSQSGYFTILMEELGPSF